MKTIQDVIDKRNELFEKIMDNASFMMIYNGDLAGEEDEVGYVVEGEGDWGEPVGFAVKGDRVTYVGPDYLEAMENPY